MNVAGGFQAPEGMKHPGARQVATMASLPDASEASPDCLRGYSAAGGIQRRMDARRRRSYEGLLPVAQIQPLSYASNT